LGCYDDERKAMVATTEAKKCINVANRRLNEAVGSKSEVNFTKVMFVIPSNSKSMMGNGCDI